MKTEPHFTALPRDICFSRVNSIGCSIGGKPLSLKCVARGKKGYSYNSQTAEMKSFADALFANFSRRNLSASIFQDELVKMEVNFWFKQRKILNYIDNLLKFVMVVIQAKAQIIDNDSQVVNVTIKKETGKENKIVDPSKYVYDGVAAQYTKVRTIYYKTQSLSLLL